MENVSIRDAALKLKDWFLGSTPAARSGNKQEKPEPKKPVAEKNSEVEEVNKPLPFTLKGIDSKHQYLQDRGIEEETAEYFGVGFFPGRGSMQGRVVIPIKNEKEELIAYAGRSIDGTEPKYKFPAGFKKSEVLFNLNRVFQLFPANREPGIVVEGFFDCMRVHQAGFQSVVALMGCSLSETLQKLLCLFPRITLFLDGDEAGQKATGEITARLIKKTFVKVVNLPDGKQPDQLSTDELKQILS
jgi:DNA primase